MDEETATGQAPRESPVARGLADMTAGEILRWAAVLAVLGYPGAEDPGSVAAPAPTIDPLLDPLPAPAPAVVPVPAPDPLPVPVPAPAPPVPPVPARPPQRPVPPGMADPDPDAAAVERIRALEVLKSAACAAQARIAAGFDASQRARQAAAGIPANRRGLGVGAQLGLARRESPHRGRVHLGLARVLVQEMPRTLAALSCGALSEWGATVLARESACLSRADRAALDERLCADPSRLEGVGVRALAAAARRQACALDPASVADRARRAVAHRTVTCRPAPDAMVYLTALLPVRQGVAVLAELAREAGRAAAGGDRRGRGQVMADTLVARATGRRAAAASHVEVQLVVTDRTLFQGDAEPAYLAGYGIVPAQWARDLVRDPNGTTENTTAGTAGTGPDPGNTAGTGPDPGNTGDAGNTAGFGASGARARRRERWRPPVPDPPDGSGMPGGSGVPVPPGVPGVPVPPGGSGVAPDAAADPGREARVWLRRLYTSPTTGQLIAMDSRARIFPEGIRRLLAARDRTCRTPWCDAPLRHHDHVVPVRSGGPTSAANGEGLCEACNYAKEAPGWAARTAPGPRHTVEYTTPTGHAYTGTAPPLPGTPEAGTPTGELLVHGSFAHTMLLQHLKTDEADKAS